MNRRDFLKGIGIGTASVVLTGYSDLPRAFGTNSPRKKPNIVFILVDDLAYHQLGCYGSDFYETPNLDRLAVQGMRFTDAYAAAPVCSPTRASIMTGKYPARLHLTDFIKGGSPKNKKLLTPDWIAYLPLREVTIAEALKSAGYVCGHFGKWHLNKDKNCKLGRPGDPGSQGFTHVLTTRKPRADADPNADPHHVKEITVSAISFIRSFKDKPFFCYIPHNTIHRPEKERKELIEKYRKKPGADNEQKYGHNNPVQAAMLETLDNSVGTVLKNLDELNLSDNTIVVFFSDNGHLGPKDSKPLRGSKADLYEGGIREPLIVRWPGVVKPRSECNVPVISNDFFPTLLEAAGLKVTDPTVDGVSLMPLLKRTGKPKREAIYWHYPHYHHQGVAPSGAVRRGDYKLIEWFEKSVDGINTEGALELFNLKDDTGEQRNLAREMPEKTAELYRKLKHWRKSVNAQEMLKNPKYSRP